MERAEREERRRQCSERGSSRTSGNIDVPHIQSRKRRSSESRSDVDSCYGSSFGSSFLPNPRFSHEENIKECTAAIVLMSLSTSPRDNLTLDSFQSTKAPPSTPQPSPAPSLESLCEDEEPTKKSKPNSNVIFQCTWRGCNQVETCQVCLKEVSTLKDFPSQTRK